MKIAILGANGRSGQAFVLSALNAGHILVAGVRNHNTLQKHDNLQTLTCDATNFEDVVRLISGCDAVVSLVGHVRHSQLDMQTTVIQNTIQAMKEINLKKIITLTGTGVRFPEDKITIIDRILNLGVSIFDPRRVNDGLNHARLLQESNLDWTILRVLKLQNTKAKSFRLSQNGPAKVIVSRLEVASAIIEILEDDKWVRKAPIISK